LVFAVPGLEAVFPSRRRGGAYPDFDGSDTGISRQNGALDHRRYRVRALTDQASICLLPGTNGIIAQFRELGTSAAGSTVIVVSIQGAISEIARTISGLLRHACDFIQRQELGCIGQRRDAFMAFDIKFVLTMRSALDAAVEKIDMSYRRHEGENGVANR
jgi:hypothetical protein